MWRGGEELCYSLEDMPLPNILIVDDEKNTREGLGAALEDSGAYEVFLARDGEEAFQLLEAEEFAVVLTDLRMSGKNGYSVIDKTISLPSRPVCIMMTAYGNVETAVEAMRRGAYDFLQKPVNIERLEHLIAKALAERKEAETLADTRPPARANAGVSRPAPAQSNAALAKRFNAGGIVGGSPALVRAIAQARQVAQSKATVLLLGETGTGKELFAKMIHNNSPRAAAPFVAVNCAALAANLLESELFGHEKGAFTTALTQRIGRFEAADGGTLFLDEIGEIDGATQVKLLRFLETRTLERVGSNKAVRTDVRLVCATNRSLSAEVARGAFREDLFYRLSVVQVNLPALRERSGDIPLLLAYYLKLFGKENSLPPPTFNDGALRVLGDYAWPGNIRELRNLCENLVVMRPGETLSEYDLEPHFRNAPSPDSENKGKNRRFSVEENEKALLHQAMVEAKGVRSKAALLLGISRRTLLRQICKWPELDVKRKGQGEKK